MARHKIIWIISYKEIYILCSFSISYLDFRKFKPRWVADKLHWGRPDLGELVQKRWMKISEDVKNPQQYFQLSVVSWIYVKEPILMEDVKVTENRITQRSQRNVPNYEKRKNNPFGNQKWGGCLHILINYIRDIWDIILIWDIALEYLDIKSEEDVCTPWDAYPAIFSACASPAQ